VCVGVCARGKEREREVKMLGCVRAEKRERERERERGVRMLGQRRIQTIHTSP